MKGKGIESEKLQINWQELMRFKRSFTEPVPQHREEEFAKAGLTAIHGRARFVGASSIQVGNDILEGRYVVIATGQKPAALKIPGSEYLTTSDQFMELDELPNRILFVGGGYIAFEFAHVAAYVGSQVTIVHRGARPLSHFDPDLVAQIVQRTRELGVEVHLKTQAEAIERSSGQLAVRTLTFGQERTFEADMVVHSAGREPELDDMNLGGANVEREIRGVRVNEFMQSISNPAVYAAGDAAASGSPALAPVASYEGTVVAANLLKGNHERQNYLGIPSVVFTIPPLASVGLSERNAQKRGLNFRTTKEMTSHRYSSRRVGETYSGFKVEEDTDRILGAHLLGERSDEVINLFGLAMRSELRAIDLKHMLFSYPTHGSELPHMLL
jgi:glutathione reductase (NADPH)